jgi:hypothetical protein
MVARPDRSSPTQRFYSVVPFPYLDHRILRAVNPPGVWLLLLLNNGRRLDPAPSKAIKLTVEKDGRPMDMEIDSVTGPIVTERMANLLLRVAPRDVQLLPARIRGSREPLFMLNITTRLNCLDRKLSIPGDVRDWYTRTVIDPKKVRDHHIFLMSHDKFEIVVSEKLKKAILDEQMVGPGLTELAPDGKGETIMPGVLDGGKAVRIMKTRRN